MDKAASDESEGEIAVDGESSPGDNVDNDDNVEERMLIKSNTSPRSMKRLLSDVANDVIFIQQLWFVHLFVRPSIRPSVHPSVHRHECGGRGAGSGTGARRQAAVKDDTHFRSWFCAPLFRPLEGERKK